MTAPERIFWFRVVGDIPEMGAYPRNIVIRDGEEVWVCKQIPIEWFKGQGQNRLAPWDWADPLPAWATERSLTPWRRPSTSAKTATSERWGWPSLWLQASASGVAN